MNKNILVFPCGSEIGLEIHNSLKFVKGLKLFGGSSVDDHGKFVYENYIDGIPSFNEDNFIGKLNEIIEQHHIDFIFPAHDSVVLKLAETQQEINAEVITSPLKTCEICRSKAKTYEFFKDESFVPGVYQSIEEIDHYPVFLKPDVGQGSKGVAVAHNKEDVENLVNKGEELVICELLPGKEYTIDCFTDYKGELRFTGMRERRRVKSGISVNSVTLEVHEQVKEIATIINEKLEFRGMWFFQVKESANGDYKLLEIAPRIAGTMSVHRNQGVNFALLSIFDRLKFDIDIIRNDFDVEVDRAFTNRFNLNIEYKRVYIDFDDTITKEGNVNPYVMMFIYQCVAKNKEIILVTKHIHDISETLANLKIDKNLFDKVIHITKDDDKYKYFDDVTSAIFIDDAFSERKMISDKFGIPVFDIDAIESLIDWRH